MFSVRVALSTMQGHSDEEGLGLSNTSISQRFRVQPLDRVYFSAKFKQPIVIDAIAKHMTIGRLV
jgi:hypothetical protein